jgi:two-component system sensor histidine kinase DctS
MLLNLPFGMCGIVGGKPPSCYCGYPQANSDGAPCATIAAMGETLAIRTESDSGWIWLLPRLAFVLFAAAVIALLWLSERAGNEEQRANLISDTLWLEQDLHFQLTHTEESLSRIGPAQAADAATFASHAQALLAAKVGLRHVLWLDSDSRLRRAYPDSVDASATSISGETARLAKSLGRPAYSPVHRRGDDWQFEAHVPVFSEGRFAGVAIGVYSLQRILDDCVPWWLAERYRIGIADTGGDILSARSKAAASLDAQSYRIPFEPPGQGLAIDAVPYHVQKPLAGRLLSAALVVLAAVVLWSLWALRRHVRRRLVAEEALRNEYAFRKAMEDSLQTGMRARDLEGRITYVNPAFCRMVGWKAEELVGRRPPMPYWPDEYFDETRDMHDRILAGHGPDEGFEIKFKRRNGEVFDVFIHEAPLIDARGRHTGWMGALIDVTERKRADELARAQQERLQATSRLVAMGEMASSLAHELNQPLAAIASYSAGCVNLLESGAVDSGEIKSALAKCAEQAQRAGRIIRRIYEFVRRAEPKAEPCDLVEILDEVLSLVESDARRQKVRVRKDIAAPLPTIQGDRVLIAQAFLNLVRNGMEALRGMPPERRGLTVTARHNADAIEIDFADTGCGVGAEAAARLFEPFFTTKAEGMGMGLNICRSVIEAHRGRLWYEPDPSGGSIFHVQFPLAEP